jgi:hypothetical protein
VNEADRVAARRAREAILEQQGKVEREKQRRRDNIAECSALVPEILSLMPMKDYPGIEELNMRESISFWGNLKFCKVGGWQIGERIYVYYGDDISEPAYLDSNGLFLFGNGGPEASLTGAIQLMGMDRLLTGLRRLRETLD